MPVEIEQAIPFRHAKKLHVSLCSLCCVQCSKGTGDGVKSRTEKGERESLGLSRPVTPGPVFLFMTIQPALRTQCMSKQVGRSVPGNLINLILFRSKAANHVEISSDGVLGVLLGVRKGTRLANLRSDQVSGDLTESVMRIHSILDLACNSIPVCRPTENGDPLPVFGYLRIPVMMKRRC
jgi:hypothetical protein